MVSVFLDDETGSYETGRLSAPPGLFALRVCSCRQPFTMPAVLPAQYSLGESSNGQITVGRVVDIQQHQWGAGDEQGEGYGDGDLHQRDVYADNGNGYRSRRRWRRYYRVPKAGCPSVALITRTLVSVAGALRLKVPAPDNTPATPAWSGPTGSVGITVTVLLDILIELIEKTAGGAHWKSESFLGR
jgi:hypothetical protein